MRLIINKAKSDPKRIVFPEGDDEKILRAAQILIEEGIQKPILIGNRDKINAKMEELGLEFNDGVPISTRRTLINPKSMPRSFSPCGSGRG